MEMGGDIRGGWGFGDVGKGGVVGMCGHRRDGGRGERDVGTMGITGCGDVGRGREGHPGDIAGT